MPSKSSNEEARTYGSAAWLEREYDFQLSKGDWVQLRKMDPMDLIEMGLADKLDLATGRVVGTHIKNANMTNVERIKRDRARREANQKGEDPNAAEAEVIADQALGIVAKDPAQLLEFRAILDQVVVRFVVQPNMEEPPEKDEDRIKGHYYTDAVPFNDKVEIFNELMKGVSKADQFREEPGEDLGDMAPKPSVRTTAKRAPRASRKRSTS
jgi:hypothetical protein